MRIFLFGASGQVGTEVNLLPTDHEIIPITRAQADLLVPGTAASLIEDEKPDMIVNAAAYTNVDGAEEEIETAARINEGAVGEIAATAKKIGAGLIHISTDYVFDGHGTIPIKETSATAPLNVYGQSKLDGEKTALENCPNAVILRTSWVYSAHGNNFVKTMLRLAKDRDELSIVADQIGGPTPAWAIAKAALQIADALGSGATNKGVYHFQGKPPTSWADFAAEIFAAADVDVSVTKIPTSDYKTPAQRPLYTVLDCSRILRDFGIEQPDWQADIRSLVTKLRKQL